MKIQWDQTAVDDETQICHSYREEGVALCPRGGCRRSGWNGSVVGCGQEDTLVLTVFIVVGSIWAG